MLSNTEIFEIAEKILQRNRTKPKIRLLKMKSYTNVAKKSSLIKQMLSEGYSFKELNIPAFYSHKMNVIYLNKEILSRLIKNESRATQIKFVKAIIYHELCHTSSKQKLNPDFENALKSEVSAEKEFNKKYPGLAGIARRISTKYSSEK